MCKWEVGENKVDEDFIYFLGEVCSCFSSLVIKSVVTYITGFLVVFFLLITSERNTVKGKRYNKRFKSTM